MRDVIPLMDQITEMDGIFNDSSPKPVLHCKLFEDNNGALELAKSPRYRPRMKHIAIKYHHFREHVKLGKVSINAIDTSEQIADIFTKGLPSISFDYLQYKLLGWKDIRILEGVLQYRHFTTNYRTFKYVILIIYNI